MKGSNSENCAPFSRKQLTAMTWWNRESPHRFKDGIICDGAVRSGKTTCMALGFLLWSMFTFSDRNFALCGKTVTALRRNVVTGLLGELKKAGFSVSEKVSRGVITVKSGPVQNTYYLFGGRDESSASLIQGVTLAGVMFDEAVLMPRSFIEQALARCSVRGAKYWFNCNPESPAHWFYREWIKKAEAKNCLYLHFTMNDNPSLGEDIKARYERLYSGVFYDRFILGRWVEAQGLVYPGAAKGENTAEAPEGEAEEYAVSCDYGTVNPFSLGLWGRWGGAWWRVDEFYYDSAREGAKKTDEEYYRELENLCEGINITAVAVDPSAASFIECIKRKARYTVKKADNELLKGIRNTAAALKDRRILIDPRCEDTLREFGLYRWNPNGGEVPVKENDHAMDDLRYFVSTILNPGDDGFFVFSEARK